MGIRAVSNRVTFSVVAVHCSDLLLYQGKRDENAEQRRNAKKNEERGKFPPTPSTPSHSRTFSSQEMHTPRTLFSPVCKGKLPADRLALMCACPNKAQTAAVSLSLEAACLVGRYLAAMATGCQEDCPLVLLLFLFSLFFLLFSLSLSLSLSLPPSLPLSVTHSVVDGMDAKQIHEGHPRSRTRGAAELG